MTEHRMPPYATEAGLAQLSDMHLWKACRCS